VITHPGDGDACSDDVRSVSRQAPSIEVFVQGKPVARRGRKARDLLRKNARLPRPRCRHPDIGSDIVKANLARFTWAVALLASMALAIGAGMRWTP
jgi:hypothetical protein